MAGLGLWTVIDRSFANELLGTNLFSGASYVLLITGLLVSFISCFGCFGAIKEVRCMLVTVRIRIGNQLYNQALIAYLVNNKQVMGPVIRNFCLLVFHSALPYLRNNADRGNPGLRFPGKSGNYFMERHDGLNKIVRELQTDNGGLG